MTDAFMPFFNLRVGQGYDVHALVPNRPLILGGIHIPHDKGLQGHSDADALLHAITDALFGGAAMGDIGRHYSDTDAAFKNADSALLLSDALSKVRAAGYRLINLDTTLICQKPKLASFMDAMQARVAEILELPVNCVNIKAKTNERLGYLGREEAIEAQAVVLMIQETSQSSTQTSALPQTSTLLGSL